MKAPILAIDFGNSRTKVAYFDQRRRAPRLVKWGSKNRVMIPSVFHLAKAGMGAILVGDDAEKMAKTDPEGIVVGLKKELHKPGKIRLGPGRIDIERVRLAAELFRFIRERCQEEVFRGREVSDCCLTVPSTFRDPQHQAVRRAAELGGFHDITLLDEPVAAAQAWLAEAGSSADECVLICDTGGRSIDCSLVRLVNGRFRLDERVSPSGPRRTGDTDIVERVMTDLVSKLVEETKRFADGCAAAGIRKPPILVVGSGYRLTGLKEKLEQSDLGPVLTCKSAEYATVLGAVTQPSRNKPNTKTVRRSSFSKVRATQVERVVPGRRGGGSASRPPVEYKPGQLRAKKIEEYRNALKAVWVGGNIRGGQIYFLQKLRYKLALGIAEADDVEREVTGRTLRAIATTLPPEPSANLPGKSGGPAASCKSQTVPKDAARALSQLQSQQEIPYSSPVAHPQPANQSSGSESAGCGCAVIAGILGLIFFTHSCTTRISPGFFSSDYYETNWPAALFCTAIVAVGTYFIGKSPK